MEEIGMHKPSADRGVSLSEVRNNPREEQVKEAANIATSKRMPSAKIFMGHAATGAEYEIQ